MIFEEHEGKQAVVFDLSKSGSDRLCRLLRKKFILPLGSKRHLSLEKHGDYIQAFVDMGFPGSAMLKSVLEQFGEAIIYFNLKKTE
jgi:hypothetical protein